MSNNTLMLDIVTGERNTKEILSLRPLPVSTASCGLCGREISGDSVAIGYGSTCYKKVKNLISLEEWNSLSLKQRQAMTIKKQKQINIFDAA